MKKFGLVIGLRAADMLDDLLILALDTGDGGLLPLGLIIYIINKMVNLLT